MPNPRNAYKRVVSGCTRGCSLNPENLPAGLGELTHKWFEEGCSNAEIIERAKSMGAKLSNGAVGRHRGSHLHAAGPAADPMPDGEAPPKMSDLEVIESVIQAGARQASLASSKVTTEQLLRAIELKHKLTEGSVFDAMFDAMAGEVEDDLADLADVEDEEEEAAVGSGQGR